MIRKTLEAQRIGRRDLMAMLGAGAVAAMGIGMTSREAQADAKAVAEAMKKLIGDKKPAAGKITLDLPQIAENGRTVPIAVEVASPMTDADHVKALHLWADKNPRPDVATFRFTPASGKARISTRIRLAKTQNIVALAEMSDGSLYMAKSEIKVTIGGCGG
ncbi:MAG: thiosulfate oxidation carrier protein SoxY [Magnetovibrio sp.]|nr:thiosulfate oxidation carrier protein SoxY [Magnetovibrio sp.]